jgi:hypothetical protein
MLIDKSRKPFYNERTALLAWVQAPLRNGHIIIKEGGLSIRFMPRRRGEEASFCIKIRCYWLKILISPFKGGFLPGLECLNVI